MPQEYEYAFYNYDKEEIISKIKALGAVKKGVYLFKVQVFIHPTKKPGSYIRVRDEGYKITMTYKTYDKKKEFDDEHEIIINDFNTGVNILLGLGCTKKYYYEKIREIWIMNNIEVVFDSMPGIPEYMEIECTSKGILQTIMKKLKLIKEPRKSSSYEDLYGIILKNIQVDFKSLVKKIRPMAKKNKKLFDEITKQQLSIYKKIKK